MIREEFEKLIREEYPKAIPAEFLPKVRNVVFLTDEEPSAELRLEEGLGPNQTLLGHYRGIPHTSRGSSYGIGATLPDTITLFSIPIMNEALRLGGGEENIRKVVRETIWHEVAHHFGMGEAAVRRRERERRGAM